MIRLLKVGGKTLGEWFAVTSICLAFGLTAIQTNWLWRFDGVIYDIGLDALQRPPDDDIVIVAIDDRSLAEIGRWPWRRGVHAGLLAQLERQGARVIAFDIILHEPAPNDVGGDVALAHAMAAQGSVILPVTHASYAARSDREGLPDERFAAAAAGLGHIHIELDPDGIARSVYLWEGMGFPQHPQLALAALAIERPDIAVGYPRPERETGESSDSWLRAGWMRIPFSGPPGTFRYVSYVDVLRGEVPDSLLRNAVVFVGSTAVGMGDMVPTPTSGHAGLMPGVEVHANVLGALRHGDIVTNAPAWVAALLTSLSILCLMGAMLRTRPRASLLALIGFIVVVLAGAWVALALARFWVPPAAALFAGIAGYPLWNWRRLEASRRYFDVELDALRAASDGSLARDARRSGYGLDSFVDHVAVLRDAVSKQRELQRSREETMHFLSHDLRAPLASIVTALEARAGKPGDDPELLARIDRSARAALGLAENLVRLVRAEGVDPLQFAELGLEMLVQDAADEVWALAHAKRLRLRTEIPSEGDVIDFGVFGDADLLRRAILNLLTNAIKYTPEGGCVTVTLRADEGRWAVDVEDSGIGIAEDQQAQLFQRFSRLQTEENRTLDGIGLGLLMVRTVAERHGGEVSVRSKPGEGSTFTLHLPAQRAASV